MEGLIESEHHRRDMRPDRSGRLVSACGAPLLLVSVRTSGEARQAITGGADILDVKEPSRGALGMADVAEIESITELCRTQNDCNDIAVACGPAGKSTIPVSVALGELSDWREVSSCPSLPKGVTFAKFGLSGCAAGHWQSDWQRVREHFERQSSSRLNWVAVGYADPASGSPAIADIISEAIESGCAGLLIDTWDKNAKTVLDQLDLASMRSVAIDCHDAGLFFAIAGKLTKDAVPRLSNIPVDVIGIRSAACIHADRMSQVDAALVADFQTQLKKSFQRQVVDSR